MSSEIPVQIDSEKLVAHTLKITANSRNFPKKYRYTVVDRVVRLTMDIHDSICNANNTYSMSDRLYYLENAISNCRNLKFYIRITHEVIHPECSIEYWDNMVSNIEKQLMNWRVATKKQL